MRKERVLRDRIYPLEINSSEEIVDCPRLHKESVSHQSHQSYQKYSSISALPQVSTAVISMLLEVFLLLDYSTIKSLLLD